jgi:MYXO-CTERM domain-containing protein
MKRTLVAASILLASSSAFAADHLMKVGEVMISNQGSTSSQFIELEDPFGEPFPSPPYTLELFNAAGGSIGSVALTIPSGTLRILVATATAATQFGVTPQATLAVTLPTNGQACFNRGTTRIHCFAWGTITSQIIAAGSNNTAGSPPDGMSIQLVSGSYALGSPTPGAANTAPVPDAAPTPDAGVIDAPPAMMPDAAISIDAAGSGNPQNPSDDDEGCSVGASASWFVLVALAGLVLLRRRPRA